MRNIKFNTFFVIITNHFCLAKIFIIKKYKLRSPWKTTTNKKLNKRIIFITIQRTKIEHI